MFVSELYTGSISDKELVVQSGVLDYIEEGDDIMADRGFIIDDLLAEKKATLNMPPLKNSKILLLNVFVILYRILMLESYCGKTL